MTRRRSMKKILLYLDTDRHASPFELLMGHDCGFDGIFHYPQMGVQDAVRLAQDALFARGPDGAKNTVIFVGGSDIAKAESIGQEIQKQMRGNLRMSVILDPRGSHTTGAAAAAFMESVLGDLHGKKVVILAGTGPVGLVLGEVLSGLGAEVTVTTRDPEKKAKYRKVCVRDQASAIGACEGVDAVVSAAPPGVRMLAKESLAKLNASLVMDLNAVPPLGIEGLKENGHGEVRKGVFGIGALRVGKLKNEVEKSLLKRAQERVGFYDWRSALDDARRLVKKVGK